MVAGLAVDLARLEYRRTAMQNTLDRAILATADIGQVLKPEDVVEDCFAPPGWEWGGIGSGWTANAIVTRPLFASQVVFAEAAEAGAYMRALRVLLAVRLFADSRTTAASRSQSDAGRGAATRTVVVQRGSGPNL